MKLCFSTLGCSNYSLDEVLKLAKRFNIDAVELRGLNDRMELSDIEELSPENGDSTLAAFREYGVELAVLGSSCRLHNKDTHADAALAVDIASRLGVPFVRVFGDRFKPDRETATQTAIDGLRSLCSDAERKNVAVLLEIHGEFCTVDAIAPIIEAVGSYRSFGIIWDVAHSDADYRENWREFYSFISPYLRHVHIKDHERNSTPPFHLMPLGEGDLPLVPIVNRLLEDGYDGYFSFEWEKMWHPALAPAEVVFPHFANFMKQFQ